MTVQEVRKSYALAFTSFLLRNINVRSINKIILYGSVAKGESAKESDVDIFIDLVKDTEKMRKAISSIVEEFYKSKEAIIFKLLGIENDINAVAGKLDEWEDLKRSIQSDGIVLWGKFESGKPRKTEHKIIFFWSRIEKNRGAFLNKLYGYKTRKKQYKGMLELWGGSKPGKSCIMIPIRHRDEMIELIKKYKINARSVEVFI